MLSEDLVTRLDESVRVGILTRWNQGGEGTRSENWVDVVWQNPEGGYETMHTNTSGLTNFLRGLDLGLSLG